MYSVVGVVVVATYISVESSIACSYCESIPVCDVLWLHNICVFLF